jgi:hypothetical protein
MIPAGSELLHKSNFSKQSLIGSSWTLFTLLGKKQKMKELKEEYALKVAGKRKTKPTPRMPTPLETLDGAFMDKFFDKNANIKVSEARG